MRSHGCPKIWLTILIELLIGMIKIEIVNIVLYYSKMTKQLYLFINFN